jgi:DNA-binding NtrC family response regulator
MRTRHRGVSVLVVAHDTQRQRRLEQALDGDDVHTEPTGGAALDSLDDAYDVVLVSDHLPDTSAEAVLEGVQATTPGVRVALVSDHPPAGDVVDRGFDTAVVEPTTTESLTRVVDRLVARTTYESNLDALYTLCVQRAKSRTDGGRSPTDADSTESASNRVARIDARIRDIRDAMDEAMATFEAADYRASFRDLRVE